MKILFKPRMVALVGVGLIAGLATWWSLAGGHVKISLKTALVKRGDVTSTISASGTIEPEEVGDVGAQVAGLATPSRLETSQDVVARNERANRCGLSSSEVGNPHPFA